MYETIDKTIEYDDDFEGIDYDNLDAEQEQNLIRLLKSKIRNMVLARSLYSGTCRPKHLAVYALLELAAEVAWDGNRVEVPDTSFFDEASSEVSSVFKTDLNKIVDYD